MPRVPGRPERQPERPDGEESVMSIGLGAVVVIVLILLLIMFLRR
jgi:uncharacterized membrane protein YidH (DUF202 family)